METSGAAKLLRRTMVRVSYLLLLVFFPLAYAGWTNFGTEFLLAFGPNGKSFAGSESTRIAIVAPEASSVLVEIPVLSSSTTYNLLANTHKYLEYTGATTKFTWTSGIEKKYIRITSTKPIAAFGFNYKQKSVDGFVAYPVTTQSIRHLAVTYQGDINRKERSYTFILVTTHTPNTLVSVKLRLHLGTSLVFQGTSYTSGNWINVTLQTGDVLGLLSEKDDLVGSQIFSTNPVAAYSGADCTDIDKAGNCDHLAVGLPPTVTLGKEFITAPFFSALRTAGDKFRMVALEDNTSVTSSKGVSSMLNSGDFHPFSRSSSEHEHFVASKPVILAQFSKSRGVDNSNIDPFMMIIPPIQQFESAYIFATPNMPCDNFLTLVIQPACKNNILLDNAIVSASWKTIVGSTFVVAAISVTNGLHHLRHANSSVRFGAYLYGNNKDITRVSTYGYPAGARLDPVMQPCQNTAGGTPDMTDNDCDGRIDEELPDGLDNDGDGAIDEDISAASICVFSDPAVTTAKTIAQTTSTTAVTTQTTQKLTTQPTRTLTTITSKAPTTFKPVQATLIQKDTFTTALTTQTTQKLTTQRTQKPTALTNRNMNPLTSRAPTTFKLVQATPTQNGTITTAEVTQPTKKLTTRRIRQPTIMTTQTINPLTSSSLTRMLLSLTTGRAASTATTVTQGNIFPQTNRGVNNRTKTSRGDPLGEIPVQNSIFPMVAGITGIILASLLVILICCLDAKTMINSLQFGLGNVREFCARRRRRRERRRRRNAVDVTND